MIDSRIYTMMESLSPFLMFWVLFFTLINISKIVSRIRSKGDAQSHNTFFVEAAGIPLTLLHSVCFIKALLIQDWISVLLFTWWGPGFIMIAVLYLKRMKQGNPINWEPYKRVISWLCKLNYLFFVLIYWHYECYGMIYVFSVWIINDQVMMLWLSDDADRARRCFHDFWFVRICYPAGLLLPFFIEFYLGSVWQVYGSFLLCFWVAGLWKVVRSKKFMIVPDDQGLLRNMAYFRTKEALNDQCCENG